MTHPLEDIIRSAEPFTVIGDSGADRFPAMSYANAAKKNHRAYFLDLGGMTTSRGAVPDGKVYTSVDELPADRTDLVVIWVTPHKAKDAVDVAHRSGAKRVWFSFKTGHKDAVAHAIALGMDVVEIGRCPVHYMDGQIGVCAGHTALMKLTGAYSKPPQRDANSKRRELY